MQRPNRASAGSPAPSPTTRRRAAAAVTAAVALPLVATAPAIADAPAGKLVPSTQVRGDGFRAAPTTSEPGPVRKRAGKKVSARGDGFGRSMLKATGSGALVGGGVKFFVNTNITFSTTSSASGAQSEASMTAPRADVSTVGGGVTSQTLNDAFDGYGGLAVHVGAGAPSGPPQTGNPNFTFYNKNGAALPATCDGREIQLPVQTVGDLKLSRRVYVPTDAPIERTLNVVENTGSAPVTVTLYVANNLGSDNNTKVTASASGDLTGGTDDNWITSFQNFSGTTSSDPRLGHVLRGNSPSDTPLRELHFVDGDDNPYWSYELTLAPGETKILANFGVVEANQALSKSRSIALAANPRTDCMTDAELRQVANFELVDPVLTLPGTQTLEATGPDGAVGNYTATAEVPGRGPIATSCLPASGSSFPIGTTTVNCTATTAGGRTAAGHFDVVVAVTSPPTFAPLPAVPPVAAAAAGTTSARVSYVTPTATDITGASIPVVCTPPSGSEFPVGTTTVVCVATDARGNQSRTSFPVVVTAGEQISKVSPKPNRCLSRRSFTIRPSVRIKLSPRTRIVRAKATLGGKALKVKIRKGQRIAQVDLRGRPTGTLRVRIELRLADGRVLRDVRVYHTCMRPSASTRSVS